MSRESCYIHASSLFSLKLFVKAKREKEREMLTMENRETAFQQKYFFSNTFLQYNNIKGKKTPKQKPQITTSV